MIDAHEGNAEPAGRPRQGRLEVGDREVGTKGVEFLDETVDERPELPRLIIEPGGNRPHHVEPPAGVLKDNPGNLLEPHPRMAVGEMLPEKGQRVGRGVDDDLVVTVEPLDERADPGGMSPALAAEADRELCHGAVQGVFEGVLGGRAWRACLGGVPGGRA